MILANNYGQAGAVDRFGPAVAHVDNGVQVDNDEQGRAVYLCRDLRSSWAATWPQLRRLG